MTAGTTEPVMQTPRTTTKRSYCCRNRPFRSLIVPFLACAPHARCRVGNRSECDDQHSPCTAGSQGYCSSTRGRSGRADIIHEDYVRWHDLAGCKVAGRQGPPLRTIQICLIVAVPHTAEQPGGVCTGQLAWDVGPTAAQAREGRRHPRSRPGGCGTNHGVELCPQQCAEVRRGRVVTGPLDSPDRAGDHTVVAICGHRDDRRTEPYRLAVRKVQRRRRAAAGMAQPATDHAACGAAFRHHEIQQESRHPAKDASQRPSRSNERG